jgi:peptidyl-prolyl cis-trans isomerase C
MRSAVGTCSAALLGAWLCATASAQQPAPAPPSSPPPQAAPLPAAAGVAATVNGQPITETAVQRGLKRVDPARHAEARPEIVNFLVDNAIIDQYLLQLNQPVDPKEVAARLERIKADIKKITESRPDQSFEKVLKDLLLTEDELKTQISADIRWDRYASAQATDKVLQEYYNANKETFDGSMVRARHILLTAPAGNAKAAEQAKSQLAGFKQQIEKETADGLAKLPPGGDALAREQARTKLLEDSFVAIATKNSACPSKAQGGDVDWFPRAGGMVEPFAKAAFALKPYQMSDIVQTQFGFHLILVTDRKPGKESKFEDVKDEVKEVYCDRLREAVCAQLRPRATVVVNPAPKAPAAPAATAVPPAPPGPPPAPPPPKP